MQYVIIGNSITSVGCIESIRKHDTTGAITVIGEENHPIYARPLISYLLQGKTDEQKMTYRDEGFYQKHGVQVLTGRRVEKIEVEGQLLRLDDGSSMQYDKLLIATGSLPFIPPMKNLEEVEHRHTFLSLSDAKELEAELQPSSRVLIIGAGLIGLKCAEGILERVQSVTVVDLADRILSSILDEEGSARVQTHLEQIGIRFHLGDSVREFCGQEALLTSGKVVGFDILVLAVGVKPNIALAKDAGLAVNKGILIDQACRTSNPHIWAGGDCSEGWELLSGERRNLALLPNAYMQGETAGYSMAENEQRFENAIAMNAIGFFGLHIITAGIYQGEDLCFATEKGYKRLFIKDDHLVGCILIGDQVARGGIYTNLIRSRTDLRTLDFAMISEQPALMAFAQKVRSEQLGRAQ